MEHTNITHFSNTDKLCTKITIKNELHAFDELLVVCRTSLTTCQHKILAVTCPTVQNINHITHSHTLHTQPHTPHSPHTATHTQYVQLQRKFGESGFTSQTMIQSSDHFRAHLQRTFCESGFTSQTMIQ